MNKRRKLDTKSIKYEKNEFIGGVLELELELPLNRRRGGGGGGGEEENGYCEFRLEDVVCNHGFFMMAPNQWIPNTKTLHRPLRLPPDYSISIMVSISQNSHKSLSISIIHHHHISLSSHQIQSILVQVKRMLRLSTKDENAVNEFQKLHPKAKLRGFGRLFRAPTLFEDVVKCILLCHSTFSGTLQMAQRLCKLQYLVSSKKYIPVEPACLDKEGIEMGNFPNEEEIVNIGVTTLEITCKLGYRAHTIIQFAKRVKEGKIKLDHEDEETEGFEKDLWKKLMKIKGVGPFVRESVMMCIGSYNRVPTDSETYRLLREVHGKGRGTKLTRSVVSDVYEPYKPFQCLAFWLDMVESYERIFGKLSELSESKYGNVGGNASQIKYPK